MFKNKKVEKIKRVIDSCTTNNHTVVVSNWINRMKFLSLSELLIIMKYLNEHLKKLNDIERYKERLKKERCLKYI